jgi:hypothetical protein
MGFSESHQVARENIPLTCYRERRQIFRLEIRG